MPSFGPNTPHAVALHRPNAKPDLAVLTLLRISSASSLSNELRTLLISVLMLSTTF